MSTYAPKTARSKSDLDDPGPGPLRFGPPWRCQYIILAQQRGQNLDIQDQTNHLYRPYCDDDVGRPKEAHSETMPTAELTSRATFNMTWRAHFVERDAGPGRQAPETLFDICFIRAWMEEIDEQEIDNQLPVDNRDLIKKQDDKVAVVCMNNRIPIYV